jgi:hypothetical protein
MQTHGYKLAILSERGLGEWAINESCFEASEWNVPREGKIYITKCPLQITVPVSAAEKQKQPHLATRESPAGPSIIAV